MKRDATVERLAHLAFSLTIEEARTLDRTQEVADAAHELIHGLPRDRRFALGGGLLLLDAFARVRHGRRLTRLDADRTRALVDAVGASRWIWMRRLGRVTTMLARFLAYQDESTFAALGYDGPWIGVRQVDVRPPPRLEERAC